MRTTREIFASLEKVSDKWEPYFPVYDRHLSRFIGKSPRVLDIGVYRGGSLEMWTKFFGAGATIVGIDCDPTCLALEFAGDVEVVIGDQGSDAFWDVFLDGRQGFDVVVDDGGHTMAQQITTLRRVFPHMPDSGIFICEDTCTSYWASHKGAFQSRSSFMYYAKESVEVLNQEHHAGGLTIPDHRTIFGESLHSVAFYNSMVVFEKGPKIPFHRVFSR